MTKQEKLDSFYKHSIESATAEAAKIIEEHQAVLDRLFEEHKETKRRQADAEILDAKEHLKKEKNKQLSAEQLAAKRSTSVKELQLIKQLFSEVTEKLKAYRSTPEYVDYLKEKIRESVAFAGKSKICFYLDPSDEALLAGLAKSENVEIQISETPFMGGIKAIIQDKNILIDHSFSSAIREERETFTFEGGIV